MPDVRGSAQGQYVVHASHRIPQEAPRADAVRGGREPRRDDPLRAPRGRAGAAGPRRPRLEHLASGHRPRRGGGRPDLGRPLARGRPRDRRPLPPHGRAVVPARRARAPALQRRAPVPPPRPRPRGGVGPPAAPHRGAAGEVGIVTLDARMPDAVSDPHRLRALEATELLDSPAEATFDRLTALATRILGVPVALVSLVTPDRQFFKSQCGLPAPYSERRETPLSHSFCRHVVEDGDALVVEDAREDPRVADNLAVSDLGVIAYAGYPIRGRDGQVLGSLCAIDDRPRSWSTGDLEILSELAAAATDVVTLRSEAVEAADSGRRLQRALVPEPGRLPGAIASAIYRPGERRSLLGGDFYLCEAQPDGSIAMVIGDVAGHGPEAAAFAMSLRSAWRALQLAPLNHEERVSRLNAIALAQQPRVGVYATGVLCAIEPGGGRAWAVNAGHPPLARLGPDGAR